MNSCRLCGSETFGGATFCSYVCLDAFVRVFPESANDVSLPSTQVASAILESPSDRQEPETAEEATTASAGGSARAHVVSSTVQTSSEVAGRRSSPLDSPFVSTSSPGVPLFNHHLNADGVCVWCTITRDLIGAFALTVCHQRPDANSSPPGVVDAIFEHELNDLNLCVRCGCSRTAIAAFHWRRCAAIDLAMEQISMVRRQPLFEHELDDRSICVRCGRSESAIMVFGWKRCSGEPSPSRVHGF